MPDDARTVPVTLDVHPDTAAALQDPATRARVGQLLGRLVHQEAAKRLPVAVDAPEYSPVDALTDQRVADHTRGHTDAERAEADDLVARFRAFAAQHTLGGLDIKELISEGRR